MDERRFVFTCSVGTKGCPPLNYEELSFTSGKSGVGDENRRKDLSNFMYMGPCIVNRI